MIERVSGVYAIVNLTDGKRYIGSAVNLERRKGRHFRELRANAHGNPHLQSAYNRDGAAAFAFEVLEMVTDRTLLVEREQWYLDTLKPEYNIARTAYSLLGTNKGEATRAKIAASLRGHGVTAETIAKLRRAKLGKPGNLKAIAAMAAANTGRKRGPRSEESRRKQGVSSRGRKIRKDVREKIRDFQMSRADRSEHLAHLDAIRPHACTPETRAKISAAHTGMKRSPEARQAMREARLRFLARQRAEA